MTIDNLPFIVAAYLCCFGAIGLYVWSLRYRGRDGE